MPRILPGVAISGNGNHLSIVLCFGKPVAIPLPIHAAESSRSSLVLQTDKNLAHFVRNFLFGPIGMLAAQECRFVTPHCPVKPVRRLPTLFRRHAPKYLNLLRTRFFIHQHGKNVRCKFEPSKPVFSRQFFAG
jgi:hypothetical protein